MARCGEAWIAVKTRLSEVMSRAAEAEAETEERGSAAEPGTRSDAIVSCLDLTSLGGTETSVEIEALCAAAVGPARGPACAAVCAYPAYVGEIVGRLRAVRAEVRVAAVGPAFPTGQRGISQKLEGLVSSVQSGADEIDVVLDWRAFLAGDASRLAMELREMCEVIAPAQLKVIIESGALPTPSAVADASTLALDAGAAFIKTSTGKLEPGAELEPSLVMLETLRDYCLRTGRTAGFKVAGGIRTVADAALYAAMTEEVLGIDRITPDRFRIGASSLLGALVEAGARDGGGAD